MVDQIDDIAWQAHQGSVAAIIQVLNDRLAETGVKTRAVCSGGVLQLLCEANRAEHLEKSDLVGRVKEILEAIAPRNIRRVRVNSRILQNQRLLWLEDIIRDPDNQLLWSEDIILRQPNPIQQFIADFKSNKNRPIAVNSTERIREERQFRRGLLIGGMSICLLLIIGGFALYQWWNSQLPEGFETQEPGVSSPQSPPLDSLSDEELFKRAVDLAQEAVALGKGADTEAQWSEIADKWGEAADLMAAVSPDYPRHATAQNRVALYRRNRDVAQEEAQKRQNN